MTATAPRPRHRCTVIRDEGDATFEVRDGQSILHGMVARGVFALKVGCRGGGCGVCRVQVLEGDYDLLPMSRQHVTVEEERDRYALACRVLARGPLVLQPAPRD